MLKTFYVFLPSLGHKFVTFTALVTANLVGLLCLDHKYSFLLIQ